MTIVLAVLMLVVALAFGFAEIAMNFGWPATLIAWVACGSIFVAIFMVNEMTRRKALRSKLQ